MVPHNRDLSRSFVRVFGRLLHKADSSSEAREDTFMDTCDLSAQGCLVDHCSSEDLPPYSPLSSAREKHDAQGTQGRQTEGIPLKRKSHFSDFYAPPKYARSLESPHNSSFDVETFHETLCYDVSGSTPQFTDTLAQNKDDVSILLKTFRGLFPDLHLQDKLANVDPITVQAIADVLCEHGYINERSLKVLCYTSVERIILAPSMSDENGLNLARDGIYSGISSSKLVVQRRNNVLVFRHTDGFQTLTELSFAGIRINDSDIQHIQRLPRLSILHLNEVGIGNEGVFLLVSLKHTLTKLFLTANHEVNNDAVPALLCLNNLVFLSILDTGIDMVGLRRLAGHMHKEDHVMDIEIPFSCEAYVDNIASQYLLHPIPPLITNPHICSHLSSAALKRNLEAHAARNSSIVASGTRLEMIERLTKILETRLLDLLVVEMLDGGC
ncbi:hypothetical protein JR316_0006384 [Psilocybe cubensis]|uniref:Uncharacterized protein n=2 Tax=Psilocybe cubensis TaxID=181762 RepID=A0A8H8CEK3_PSICU|nr:hypothetical protein JR316_0006384 [Psilocybe cubensis]KAH9481854.1 hypothetical protein JR316_0006384 [Psilocybe cubensis]